MGSSVASPVASNSRCRGMDKSLNPLLIKESSNWDGIRGGTIFSAMEVNFVFYFLQKCWFLTSSHRNIPNHPNLPNLQNPIAPNIPSPRNIPGPSIPSHRNIPGPIPGNASLFPSPLNTFGSPIAAPVPAEIDHVVIIMALVFGFEGNLDTKPRETVRLVPIFLG